MHPQHIITYEAMAKHLDWENREPTYFISLFDDLSLALREADRRRNQPRVPREARRRNPASVHIAQISVHKLDHHDVFYFSRNELISMLQAPPNNPVSYNSTAAEWFVMEFVPDDAVVGII